MSNLTEIVKSKSNVSDSEITNDSLTSLVNNLEQKISDGLISSGNIFCKTASYHGGYNATLTGRAAGGAKYELIKAANDAASPTEDGGFIIHVASQNGGYYLKNISETRQVTQWGAKGDGLNDDNINIQNYLSHVRSFAGNAYFPITNGGGIYLYSETLSYEVSDMTIEGETEEVTLKYTGSGTGLIINLSAASPHRERCGLKNITLASSTGSVAFDFTFGSYGLYKNFNINYTAPNAKMLFATGHNGAGPYYNHFDSPLFIGGVDRSQTAILFDKDSSGNLSPGPNANIVTNVRRAASLSVGVDLRAGTGNLFSNFSGESIRDDLIRINWFASYADNGIATSITSNTLTDTSKNWSTNQGDLDNWIGMTIVIQNGEWAGQVRRIVTNTSNTLTVDKPWPANIGLPNYSLVRSYAFKNMFNGIRQEGLASDNPNGIRLYNGARGNEFSQIEIGSLGTGKTLIDESGDTTNKVGLGSLITKTFVLNDAGANASIDVIPRNGTLGGIREGSLMALDYIELSSPNFSEGSATCTLTVDHGGSTTGGGLDSLEVVLDSVTGVGNKSAYNYSKNKEQRSTSNNGIFAKLTTNADMNPAADVIVTIAYRVS